MVSCSKYNTVEARKARCRELKLCFCCTSYKHLSDKCPGKENKLSFPCYFCKQNTHISALCPEFKGINPVATHLCLNMGASCSYQPYLLPVISLNIRRGKTSQRVRCLIDDGSQRSYLSEEVANMLGCGDDNWSQLHYDVNTFLGSSKKAFKECIMDVEIPGFKSLPLPILVDTEFAVQFQVSDLEVALENIKSEGHKLIDPCLAEQGNTIKVQGLLGVDIIQFFPKMEKIRCMHGSAWLLNTGIVPFGNIMHFLHPSQIRNTVQANVPDSTSTNFVSAVERYGSKDCDTLVNYVLEPKKTYFSPLEETFPESSVEQGLEKMFSLESVGCSETSEDQSKYDSLKIEEFKANIKYDDHKYSVVLPWHDKIEQVPSNANVAIAILNKVVGNLKEKGQLKAYQDVFAKQLSDNIIEKIDVDPESFHKHVWIPHRPIVRTDPNITTKIRPVFNCSLKVNDKPSLNEAAYAGVNLMADLTKLVLYFRSNRYVMLGDIKQAFLQIELAHEEDKNRFSFFMIENDRLVAYRYRTIIFGFNASPFILNYVIKHHASKYPDDECTRILLSNFYVDNLIITGDSEEKLGKLYKECSSRMKEGGFLLRSWNSNSKELQKVFTEDEVISQHNNNYEKVLGYKYLIEADEIQVNEINLNLEACTKRDILSQISKVFDPLGLYLPVTTKGKILMRELWTQKLSWDDTLPEPLKKQWTKLGADLCKLSSVSFPRNCISDVDSDCQWVVFCDASKLCYGFSIYNVSKGKAQLIFAKAKVAPQKEKTLATLELMSVYLALKSLPLVLDSFPNIKVPEIIVAVDSQIVLSWLLSENAKTKNVFTLNRIKDVSLFKKGISDDYQANINFKFVNSEYNPADLITRGLAFQEFEKKKEFWCRGPQWLNTVPLVWPDHGLGCLSEESKVICRGNKTSSFNIVASEQESCIDITRFSTLSKLLGVTRRVFSLYCKNTDKDPMELGKLYLIKKMQRSTFKKELEYLQGNNS